MPKQTSNKKVVASKGGRKISTPLGILIVVGVGLLLAIVGTFGYTKYKERDLKAKAGSYATIVNRNGFAVAVCRTYNTAGRYYIVTAIASKPATSKAGAFSLTSYDASHSSARRIAGSTSSAWWGGTVTVTKTVVWQNHWYEARINNGLSSGSYHVISPRININYTPNC